MKISVGICTHNGEKYIAEQLESIIFQSIKPYEIILADDASQDTTVEIAKKILMQSDIHYEIVTYDTHQGILKNFSNCLGKCTGDIIFSCDQDDVWMLNKIEKFLDYFEKGYNFVYSNAVVVDSNRNLLEKDFWRCYGINFEKISPREFSSILLKNCCVAGCNMAFTKELYDKVKPIPYHFLHDGWLAICAPWFGRIGFINEPLIEYRRHGKNVSDFQTDDSENKEKSNDQDEKRKKYIKCINQVYRKELPDRWFGDSHYYTANKIFLERMQSYISSDYAQEVDQNIKFNQAMLQCLPKHKFKSIVILLKEFINGNYKKFRGNAKRLLQDILYICVNENSQFEHDMEKW